MTSLFRWLDLHPRFYWEMTLLASVALVAWVAIGLWRNARARPLRGSSPVFSVLLLLGLIAWRWPYLLSSSEYNPDESQFIAGAMALTRDPVFWRSVDGVTSGPLDFYALLPLHWLGVPLDYFGARLTALLLSWGSLLLLGRFFRARVPAAVAQLAVLPGAAFFAAASVPDFIHYSSELAPLALLALALACLERRPLVAAVVAGCLPWAKLQAAPLALILGLWLLGQEWRASAAGAARWRRVGLLLCLLALPTFMVTGLVAAFGQWEHFYRRFFLQNVAYVGGGQDSDVAAREMLRFARESGHFLPWLWASLVWIGLGTGWHLWLRRRLPVQFWLGALLAAAALVCIATPSRSSLHYLFFLSIPLAWWGGVTACSVWNASAGRGRWLLGLLTLVVAVVPLRVRWQQPEPGMIGQLAAHWRRPYGQVGQVLRHWEPDHARLALWGWMSFAYVEGGLPQATQDTVSQWCILDVPQRDYYRATFLADIERNRPELFVDAVGPGAPIFEQRPVQAHETFPALAAYIGEHYDLVVDLQLARIYVRRDFLAAHPLSNSELQRVIARSRRDRGAPVPPTVTRPAQLPQNWVGGKPVRVIEPPAEMHWKLDGTERGLRVDFGMHPKTYTEGATDGGELIAELRMPGQPPLQVLHRAMDPVKQPGDRGPLSGEIDLPPFPPGSELVVRSTTGPSGNNAWDWIYVEALRFVRSPFYSPPQFPGFRRIPNRVDAVYPYLVHTHDDSVLMLPPPTTLTFILEGRERQFNFSFGLAEGAYTRGGQTDGANFVVDLERAGQPVQNLFTRRIDPLGEPNDRGRQDGDLILPPDIRAGDCIVLRIEAGPGAAWDWTYVSALDLR